MTKADVTDLHQRSVEHFVRIAAQVRPDQWEDPTPCTDWSVRDLVNHVVSEERWTVPLMRGSTMEEVGARFDGDLLGDRPDAAVREAAAGAVDAISEPGAVERTVHLSFGDTPAGEYANQLFADHLVHSWDLAKAIGADDRLDTDLVAACADWFMPMEELYRGAGAVASRIPLPREADGQTRLLASFGRYADWTPQMWVLQRFGDAFNAGDVDAIMEMMTDDCVFESTGPAPDGVRAEGQAAVRGVWDDFFTQTRQPHFDTEDMFACGDHGLVRWRFTWVEPDGSTGHVRGVDVLRLRDGKVAEKLSYVKG